MTVPVTYDLTRLLLRSFDGGPNGIDRVDSNLARYFLRPDAQQNAGVLLSALRPTALKPRAAHGLLDTVDKAWGADCDLMNDLSYQAVRKALLINSGETQPPPSRIIRSPPSRAVTAVRMASVLAPQLVVMRSVQRNAVFIHTTQFPSVRHFQWLDRRPDVKPVFFVHDLLPMLKPEFFTVRNAMQHRQFLDVFLRFACAAIVNTEAVKNDLEAFIRSQGGADRPILVAPMPAETLFAQPGLADAALQARPYFVMCGTIEPRKNHRLILDLWQNMARDKGVAAPRLVIIGRRGWNNASIFDQLDHTPWVKSHVIEAAGLTSSAIAAIVANACALLMPSFAEGYGFPVVEALAAGTPAIVSDIAVFREARDRNITYCKLNDHVAWLDAINFHVDGHSSISQKSETDLAESWNSYFGKIESFIGGL